MPFGIEIGSTISGRTTAMGYGASDGVRDQFTGQQRDTETGLDFFQARYYSNSHGRFLSADPLQASADTRRPQTWNRYSYVLNNPLKLVDPSGMSEQHPSPEDSSTDLHGSGGGGALTGGAYKQEEERESTEEAAVETGISESIEHEQEHQGAGETKLSQADCDAKLGGLFTSGDNGPIAASANEPSGVLNGIEGLSHLALHGVIHVYANNTGTPPSQPAGLYSPAGGRFTGGGEYEEKWTDANKVVHHTGNYSNEFRFQYPGGLVIKYFHVGGTFGGDHGGATLGKFGQTNAKGSIRIGNIGGLGGGENRAYFHSHIEFDVRGVRTDPRKIYCGW